jgi:hypothetical protein
MALRRARAGSSGMLTDEHPIEMPSQQCLLRSWAPLFHEVWKIRRRMRSLPKGDRRSSPCAMGAVRCRMDARLDDPGGLDVLLTTSSGDTQRDHQTRRVTSMTNEEVRSRNAALIEAIKADMERVKRLHGAAPEMRDALNYVADMTYVGADGEWHFKRGYDPQLVLNAVASAGGGAQ